MPGSLTCVPDLKLDRHVVHRNRLSQKRRTYSGLLQQGNSASAYTPMHSIGFAYLSANCAAMCTLNYEICNSGAALNQCTCKPDGGPLVHKWFEYGAAPAPPGADLWIRRRYYACRQSYKALIKGELVCRMKKTWSGILLHHFL